MRGALSYFNCFLLMVVRKGKATTINTSPKDVLGLPFAGESLKRFIIHTPNYSASYGKSDLVDVAGMMFGAVHYATQILA